VAAALLDLGDASGMTARARLPLWLVFLALGFMWGSSYFWIKIGVETIPPLTLIALRLFFGFLVIAAVVAIAREPLPRNPRQYGHLLVMAVVSIVLPFFLITWGEHSPSMDSALAAILNSTVPLFVLVLAPVFLPDERITLPRVAGLVLGFVGVVVLFAPGLVNVDDHDFVAEAALLGSAVSYAVGVVYARRNVQGLRPMIPALFQVTFALVIAAILALVIERPIGRVTPAPEAIVAILWLGILGSGVAYLAFFRILREAGATRTSLVAYLLPVVGIALGTVRGEAITVERVIGTALIIVGIALVNTPGIGRWWRRGSEERIRAATESRADPAGPE
jgi:drug/metabolite transporter (DMT)-like permease